MLLKLEVGTKLHVRLNQGLRVMQGTHQMQGTQQMPRSRGPKRACKAQTVKTDRSREPIQLDAPKGLSVTVGSKAPNQQIERDKTVQRQYSYSIAERWRDPKDIYTAPISPLCSQFKPLKQSEVQQQQRNPIHIKSSIISHKYVSSDDW